MKKTDIVARLCRATPRREALLSVLRIAYRGSEMTRRMTRTGFSLIEILVVIAIMAILGALAAGVYFKVRGNQSVTSTEATLTKLSTGLERLWSADRDQIEKEFTSGNIQGGTMSKLMAFCGGPNERERAKAVYMYLRMKREYPQTLLEAQTDIVLNGGPTLGVVLQLKAKPESLGLRTLAAGAYPTPADANEANLQASVLLYRILTEKSTRGETFDADAVNGFVAEKQIGTAGNFRVFIDAWGTPITYVRFLSNSEINEKPHARNPASLFQVPFPYTTMPASISNSPFDVSARINYFIWNETNFNIFCASAGIVSIPVDQKEFRHRLMRRNFLPSVISAGPDGEWQALDVRGVSNSANVGIVEHDPAGNSVGTDNIYGYRLRQFGARGN